MTTFLTAQEMQELINVDRSTVYRMAEDGRLPGVKIGRQWRFPAEQVAVQFGLAPASESANGGSHAPRPDVPGRADRLSDLLAPGTAEPVAELLGDLLGVMAVITDMDGMPLTSVAHQCGFYRTVGERPESAASCVEGWRQLAEEPNVAPRFVPSHFGFLCARTFVWVDLRPVGMIVVGGVTPDVWPPSRQRIVEIAAEVGLDPDVVGAAVCDTWDVPAERQAEILRLLPKFGDLISQIASARSRLPVDAVQPHRREAS